MVSQRTGDGELKQYTHELNSSSKQVCRMQRALGLECYPHELHMYVWAHKTVVLVSRL